MSKSKVLETHEERENVERVVELKGNIYDFLELVDNEKDVEHVFLNVASAMIDINPICKLSDGAKYRSKIFAILSEIKEDCILEYFYYFIAGKLGKLSPEEVLTDVHQ